MNNKENELDFEQLHAQIAYWGLPHALTTCIERILRNHPIKRHWHGYSIDLGNDEIYIGPLDLEEYLQWLERAYPKKAKEIRERVRAADELFFGRNYEAM